MIKEFLDSLEDPDRPLLGPNIWMMKKTGILLPHNTLGKILYIIMHEIVTFFVMTQFIELYVIRSDLDEVLVNLKISMLSSVCMGKSHSFILRQKDWRELIDYVTEADKYERETRDKARGKVLDTYTKYCRNITYFYWALLSITCILVLNTPLLKYVSSSNYRNDLKNGTALFQHIFSAWIPIDKYHSPGLQITVLWQVVVCLYGTFLIAAYDVTVVVIMVYFGGKFDLLRIRCKQMMGEGGNGVSNEETWRKIRHLHTIHMELTKYYKMFNSLLSPVMFFYVVVCALMLCASVFQLTSATTTTQKLLMAEYLVFGITQLFIICWHSNDVLKKSGDLIYGPYESEWWAANIYQKKGIHLLSGQFGIIHVFSAGPFTDLTLATFITILKGAYSYYTLLRKE